MCGNSPWTEERVELLKKRWVVEGRSAGEIAIELGGVSRNAVIGKINRMGLMGRSPNKQVGPKTAFRNVTRKPAPQHWPAHINMKPAVKPTPIAIEKMLNPAPPAETVSFENLTSTTCRYPYRKNGEAVYCGKPVLPGSDWCRDCYGRTHQKDSAARRARQMEAAE